MIKYLLAILLSGCAVHTELEVHCKGECDVMMSRTIETAQKDVAEQPTIWDYIRGVKQ